MVATAPQSSLGSRNEQPIINGGWSELTCGFWADRALGYSTVTPPHHSTSRCALRCPCMQTIYFSVPPRVPYIACQTSEQVRSRLIPYFATVHPEKGKILGPFTKLSQWPHLRRLALNVTAVLLQDADMVDPLRSAVDNAVRDTEDARYWCTLQGSN